MIWVNYLFAALRRRSNYKCPGKPLGEIDPKSTAFKLGFYKPAISGNKKEG